MGEICQPATLDDWFTDDDSEYCVIDIPDELTQKEKLYAIIWSKFYNVLYYKK